MSLKKVICNECGRRVIIDTRELDEDDDMIVCPHCAEPIELPHAE